MPTTWPTVLNRNNRGCRCRKIQNLNFLPVCIQNLTPTESAPPVSQERAEANRPKNSESELSITTPWTGERLPAWARQASSWPTGAQLYRAGRIRKAVDKSCRSRLSASRMPLQGCPQQFHGRSLPFGFHRRRNVQSHEPCLQCPRRSERSCPS